MCLVCRESQRKILISEGLFAVTRTDSDHRFPVSGELVRMIPPGKKRGRRCEPGERGIDIYQAKAKEEGDFFSGRNWELDKFICSIPAETAREIFSNLFDRFDSRR